jgi:alpha-glucosidase
LHTAYNFALLVPGVYNTKSLRGAVEEYLAEGGDCWPSWAFANHDTMRVASRWAVDGKPDQEQVKMLGALVTTLRGTSFIYQGEELGLTEADIPFELLQDPFGIFLWPEDKGRDGCRTPFPWDGQKQNAGFSDAAKTWLPVPIEHMGKAAAQQEADGHSPLHFVRGFLKWRKTHAALVTGDIRFIDTPDGTLGFIRSHDSGDVMCCFNLGNTPATIDLPLDSTAMDGHGMNSTQDGRTVNLPAFGGYFGRI